MWSVSFSTKAPLAMAMASFDAGDAERRATAIIARSIELVTDPIWRFELAALAYQSMRTPLLVGQSMADALGKHNGASLCLPLPARCNANAALFCTRAALARAGLGHPPSRIYAQSAQWLCGLIAPIICAWLLVRHGGSSPRALVYGDEGQALPAVHGEDTTRTRHLRQALAAATIRTRTLLILGRPSRPLADALAAFDPKRSLGDLKPIRPIDIASLVRSLPKMLRHTASGVRQIARCDYPVSLREQLAISYRFTQGAAHANWWRRLPPSERSRTIIFGHTGTADTSLLEQAMQSDGSRTVHAVHGTNTGWPFAGLSSSALFQTGADARLGATLPAYARCTTLPMSCPGWAAGDEFWALLTSYTHVHSQAYRQHGADADIALVALLRDAADALGQSPDKILWRPHPQIEIVAHNERRRLVEAVKAAGFRRWPDDEPYEALARMGAVVTTPSTALIDALRLGKPAILAVTAPLQTDMLYGQYPLLTSNCETLVRALQAVIDSTAAPRLLHKAWASVEPGSALNLERLSGI